MPTYSFSIKDNRKLIHLDFIAKNKQSALGVALYLIPRLMKMRWILMKKNLDYGANIWDVVMEYTPPKPKKKKP